MEQSTNTQKRPLFLTILCVLSFLGSSYYVSSSFISYSNPAESYQIVKESFMAYFDQMEDTYKEGSQLAEMLERFKADIEARFVEQSYKKMSLLNLLGNFCTLLGAMFMWRGRRFGFHVYVAGNLVIIGSAFVIYGFGFTAGILSAMPIIFALIFVSLYALNLKHLN